MYEQNVSKSQYLHTFVTSLNGWLGARSVSRSLDGWLGARSVSRSLDGWLGVRECITLIRWMVGSEGVYHAHWMDGWE